MNLENIPTYLKEYAPWYDSKYEKRESGTAKVSYKPKTGGHAYVEKPDTFSDFESAASAIKKYDGIDIRVDKKTITIDLDHCIENGKLTDWAAEIVSHFKNTYIEISPSGTGLRILLFTYDGYIYDKNTY